MPAKAGLQFSAKHVAPPFDRGDVAAVTHLNTAVISHTMSCPPSSAVCDVCRAGREAASGNIFTHSALSTSRLERSFIQTFILMMSSVEPPAAAMIERT